MYRDRFNFFLSFIGVLAVLFILITGPLNEYSTSYLLLQIFGILLIAWSLVVRKLNKHHHGNLAKGLFFVDKGPYEIIRHPIYAGFILVINGFVQEFFTLPRAIALLVILAVIVAKIVREEYMLEHHVEEYVNYKKRTHKLIPYIF